MTTTTTKQTLTANARKAAQLVAPTAEMRCWTRTTTGPNGVPFYTVYLAILGCGNPRHDTAPERAAFKAAYRVATLAGASFARG